MPAEKKTDAPSDKAGDQAKAEVQEAMDAAHEQGYVGTVPDPFPNEAYSLQSGPDSPTVRQQTAAVKEG